VDYLDDCPGGALWVLGREGLERPGPGWPACRLIASAIRAAETVNRHPRDPRHMTTTMWLVPWKAEHCEQWWPERSFAIRAHQ